MENSNAVFTLSRKEDSRRRVNRAQMTRIHLCQRNLAPILQRHFKRKTLLHVFPVTSVLSFCNSFQTKLSIRFLSENPKRFH
ncbi:hypothetical protein L1887_00593 [Cichorium endivia]|nr:hypothetical protein L1887_00593 [Cichorium endivia]